MKSSRKDNLAERFDDGQDASRDFDFSRGTKTVNVDLPIWAIKLLDEEASRRGVARQALIKMWLIDRLDLLHEKNQSA